MNKIISLILLLSILLSFAGCQKEEPLKEPVNFYYHKIETEFGKENGVIDAMVIEGEGKKNNHKDMLNEYLRGINGSTFSATFPTGTQITDLRVLDGTAYLILNPVLGQYTGMNLTIACACLSLTTMELTGAKQVSIRLTSGTLNGSDQIIMDRNSLLLLDVYVPEQTKE